MFKVLKGLETGFQMVQEALQGQCYNMVVRQRIWEKKLKEQVQKWQRKKTGNRYSSNDRPIGNKCHKTRRVNGNADIGNEGDGLARRQQRSES